MSKWLLILVISYVSDGNVLQFHEFDSKEACKAIASLTVQAATDAAHTTFKWSGTCVNLDVAPSLVAPDENPPKKQTTPEAGPVPNSKYRDIIY